MAHGSEKALREKGLFKLEGKEYPVKDGDILNIRFKRLRFAVCPQQSEERSKKSSRCKSSGLTDLHNTADQRGHIPALALVIVSLLMGYSSISSDMANLRENGNIFTWFGARARKSTIRSAGLWYAVCLCIYLHLRLLGCR
jgi:hypothetical protein